MSKIAGRNDASGLRVLLSQQTISRRGLLLSSLAGATSLALAGGSRYAMAADSSLRSLTYSGQRWGMVQEGMAPQFSEATGVEVEVVTFPISQGYARILNALGIGSSEYDVIDLDYGILAQIANRLEPLDPYVESDSAYATDYEGAVPANVRGLYRFDGERLGQGTTYGIANDSNTQLGFYRTDVFEKAGIETPPKTWDEVLAVAKELTVDTPAGKQYGFTTNGKRGIFSSTLFGQMLFSYGGNWLDENNAPTLTTPEAEEALSMIEKLMSYADPSVVNAGDNETINAMASGVAVYAPNAWGNNAFTNPQLNDLAEVTKAVIVPRGAVPNGKNSPLMGGFGLVIPATAKNKEAAWKFIQFLTRKDNMKAYVEFSGQPARVDALKEYASTAPMFSALADSLPNGVYQPGWLRDQSGFYQALGTQVSLVMTGQKSVSEALQQAQEDCTAVLKRSGDMK
jgi:ABC-type glycerol-3-phosphate transport system substrate-binding protein